MPTKPTDLAVLAELHSALAGAERVIGGHPLDDASYLLGVASALTWVDGIQAEAPIARLVRLRTGA